MKKNIIIIFTVFCLMLPLSANESGSSLRFSLDAGEMVHNAFIVDNGFYVPMEIQYLFGNLPFALMGGITISTHKTEAFDVSFSTGVKWYTLKEKPDERFGGTTGGVFFIAYPLYEISPVKCIREKRFVWNTMLGAGLSNAWNKHFFTEFSVGWIFSDIPNGPWYVGGLALSLKLGFILPL